MDANGNGGEIRSTYSSFRGRGSLKQLVDELERQISARVDFVADTRQMKCVFHQTDEKDKKPVGHLRMVPNACQVAEYIPDEGVPILPQAFTQLTAKESPKASHGTTFFKALRAENPLRAAQFITALMHDKPTRRQVRVLDGSVRAWLGSTYRIVDNYSIALTALEHCRDHGGEVIEAVLSDSKMKLKFISRDVWDRIDQERTNAKWNYAGGLGNQEWLGKVGARTEGDLPHGGSTVFPVVTVGNSETGHGQTTLDLGALLAACWNLAIVEEVVAQIHVGGKLDEQIFTRETIEANSKSTMLKLRDGIGVAFDAKKFGPIVQRMRTAQSQEILAPTPAVSQLIEATDITEGRKDSILQHFLQDYDTTRFGLAQAVSRVSQDAGDEDESSTLEKVAGQLIRDDKLLKGGEIDVFQPAPVLAAV